jgi:apolipoprotein N-acyltransferase
MNKYTLVALSLAGGILSGLAWTGWCSGLILLVSFVPFLIIENNLYENSRKFTSNAVFIYLLPGFVIFSIIAVGWMRIASITGAICVIMGLAFLMSFTIWLAHIVRLRAGNFPGIISFLTFWLSYEFISLNVNIVSPWLNLGNGLSKDILFIQWYEVTGTAGGTLWILTSNILFALLLISLIDRRRRKILYLILWLPVVIVPSFISIIRYNTIRQNKLGAEETVVIQPCIDPYTEKFIIPFDKQLRKVINLAVTGISGNTVWVITPETTVDDPVNLDDLNNDNYIRMLRDLAFKYPSVSIVTGMVSYRSYPPASAAPTPSARIINSSGYYYDHYNSAFKIDTGKTIELYHKSKLVPGIEMQFSNGPGRLISKILPGLGGTKWGYGVQKERVCFENRYTSTKVAPVICYESVFGEFVSDYVRKGANALFIITNDGWWKNTNGYKQHLSFASIRAVETRRPLVRAANTGISCIIDIKGKRIIESNWWTQSILRGEFIPETRLTPYVRYGDYLLRISVAISIILIFIVFIAFPLRKKHKQKSGQNHTNFIQEHCF